MPSNIEMVTRITILQDACSDMPTDTSGKAHLTHIIMSAHTYITSTGQLGQFVRIDNDGSYLLSINGKERSFHPNFIAEIPAAAPIVRKNKSTKIKLA